MRVCVVDLNGPFGPLRSFVQLVEPLVALGIDCEFVVSESSVDLLKAMAPEAAVHVVQGGHSTGRDLVVARRIRSLRVGSVDLVHANSTSGARGAVLGAGGAKTPLVVHLRNSRLSRKERFFLDGLARRQRAAFVAVSRGALSEAGSVMQTRATVIPDPTSAVQPRSGRPPGNPTRIGVVANQQPTKGFDVFVRAVECLSSENITWDVFGSAGVEPPASPYVAQCRARLMQSGAAGAVALHGVVPSMEEWYCDLDVMLVTSRRESFSRVCVEAMLAGTPLVAPSIPGLVETVGGGRFATMYEAGNGDAAAAAICAVLADYDYALETVASARLHAQATFDPTQIAARLATVYRALSDAGP